MKNLIIYTIAFFIAADGSAQTTTSKKVLKPAAKTTNQKVISVGPNTQSVKRVAPPTQSAAAAAAASVSKTKAAAAAVKPSAAAIASLANDKALNTALELAKNGKYYEASMRLFELSRNPRYAPELMRIKYLLGLMLYELKLNQVSAYQFVNVVKDGTSRYIKKSLEKLSISASLLNDRTLLNYAIAKVDLADFPKEHQDMLRFRIGEFEFANKLYQKAAASLQGVGVGGPYYAKAKYTQALSYVELGQFDLATQAFNEVIDSRKEFGVTDQTSVVALLGVARTQYQKKDWDAAISTYRQIPRDTSFWHDSLLELSWAQLRGGKFRSVLGNFHSIHSPFYDDTFQPESLLLRSILYLYICQYSEMEKTLDLFEKNYTPIHNKIKNFLSERPTYSQYYKEMLKVSQNWNELQEDVAKRERYKIPFVVAKSILREGDYKAADEYVNRLLSERNLYTKMPAKWKSSGIGVYSLKLLNNRIQAAEIAAGTIVQNHLITFNKQLSENFEQAGFARYELVNARKERIKKGLVELPQAKKVDEGTARDYYIQNGYQYYPFMGEFWLDELGNYYYLGTRSCE